VYDFLLGYLNTFFLILQGMLIACGNLSFLNHLTMLPALWCLDDQFFQTAFEATAKGLNRLPFIGSLRLLRAGPSEATVAVATNAASTAAAAAAAGSSAAIEPLWNLLQKHGFHAALTLLLVKLSAPAAANLVVPWLRNSSGGKGNKKQVMNGSFNRWRLMNAYGAFGFVGDVRDEIVVSGTRNKDPSNAEANEWREYTFAALPSGDNMNRRLPWPLAPYHHRLDWCLWFANLQSPTQTKWLPALLLKLLKNDPDTTALLAQNGNPFSDGDPPLFLKVERYRYSFTKPGKKPEALDSEQAWYRERIGWYFPRQPIFSAVMLE